MSEVFKKIKLKSLECNPFIIAEKLGIDLYKYKGFGRKQKQDEIKKSLNNKDESTRGYR